MSNVSSVGIEDVAKELSGYADSLQQKYNDIVDTINEIEFSVKRLESINGMDASEQFSETIGLAEATKHLVSIYKYIWRVKVSNASSLSAYLSSSAMLDIEENIDKCNLQSVALIDASATILGLILALEHELSSPFDGNVANFFNQIKDNETWNKIKTGEVEQNIIPARFDVLEHLNLYNQTGIFAYYTVIDGGRTIKDTACGLSVLMSVRYLLTGEDSNYMEFAKEAYETGLYNGNGSDWSILDNENNFYETKYGIKSREIENSYESIVNEIKNGNPVVTIVHEGLPNIEDGGFNISNNAHFIALVDYNEATDQVYVYNPNENNAGWNDRKIIERFVVKDATLVRSMSTVD